jgi:xanthine dehydrogenase accessory factor
VDAALIARLICPIGVPGIESKWPAAIAIGVAAQLLQAISAYQAEQRIGADAQAAEQAPTGCGERSCEDCHTSHAPLK